jgi:hypothetical protein
MKVSLVDACRSWALTKVTGIRRGRRYAGIRIQRILLHVVSTAFCEFFVVIQGRIQGVYASSGKLGTTREATCHTSTDAATSGGGHSIPGYILA